jgi:tetratricopeptide (TPR) repeat protein
VHDGEHDAAVENLERSLELKRELGDRLGEATLLNNLGVVFYRAGDDTRARELYSASLGIKEEIGDGYGRAIALTNLALVETHVGQLEGAAVHLDEAERAAGAVGARWLLPEIKRVAAQRALALHDTDAALAQAEESLQAAEDLGVPTFIGVAHRVLGVVKGKGCGDGPAADEHFETSLAVFEMLENEHELAKTHAAYGEMLNHFGRADEAQPHLKAAMTAFRASGARGRLDRLEPLVWD